MEYLKNIYNKEIESCPLKRPFESVYVLMNMYACGMAFREHYSESLREMHGGICPYSPKYGFYRYQSPACDKFAVGERPYPWGAKTETNVDNKEP